MEELNQKWKETKKCTQMYDIVKLKCLCKIKYGQIYVN